MHRKTKQYFLSSMNELQSRQVGELCLWWKTFAGANVRCDVSIILTRISEFGRTFPITQFPVWFQKVASKTSNDQPSTKCFW